MKIIIAMDSFKETMSADSACDIVADILRDMQKDIEVITKPMADGGEGTASAMISAGNGQWITKQVTGPLMEMQIEAGFGWFEEDKCAVVEMATASGLELLTTDKRNPLKTTTYGTGQLIQAAIEHGAKKVLLTVGGSATVDCGIGAAIARGWRFPDEQGEDFCIGKTKLTDIEKIIHPKKNIDIEIEILCDVDNPLCGQNGAAKIYSPQKGATPQMVNELEAGLKHIAQLTKEQLNIEIANLPGAGAAGGLAAGAVAFMNGKLVSGIETIMAHCNLAEELETADWVITGEGKFDEQSLNGKVVSGITNLAKQTNTKIAVIAGKVDLSEDQWKQYGIDTVLSCQPQGMNEYEAMAQAHRLLGSTTARFATDHLNS